MTRALAMTTGDPGGIGLDIAIGAWLKRREENLPPFHLLSQPEIVSARARLLGLSVEIATIEPCQTAEVFDEALPIVTIDRELVATPGCSMPENAAGILASIDKAVASTMAGDTGAVVTLPIAKKPLHDAGFKFPGHTEYLAYLAQQYTGDTVKAVMMLAGPELRAVPVTIHIALEDVPAALTRELIAETCRTTAADLRDRFGIACPRLAVAGLNPHAGEDGAFGLQERTVIGPALEMLRAEGLSIAGPLPADTMFHARARQSYDAAICMYHDQALIPAKALDFDCAVNVTLGLPFVRTSPDHGTAFDIAGSGKANPQSLIEALRLAAMLADNATTVNGR